jgi:glycosyltransferase involved in cell wall biosynthesis
MAIRGRRTQCDGKLYQESPCARGYRVPFGNRDTGSITAELGRKALGAIEQSTVRVPKVSVVLTTYNRAHLLGATIESILSQTLEDFELIVCDDASQDATERVGREYEKRDHRVRYRRGLENLGMPGNLNAGIEAAAAEYIANLHDGDLYERTLIEKWSAALDRFPRAAFVFNAYRAIDANGHTVCIFREPLEPCVAGSALLEQIFFRRWRFDSPVWGTVMGRRSAYLAVGLFDPRFGFVADVDMWLRLAERFDVAYIPEPLIVLPSREAVPRIWSGAENRAQAQTELMFWEARMRHYRGSPVRRATEAVRHSTFVAATRAMQVAYAVNRRRRQMQRLVQRVAD